MIKCGKVGILLLICWCGISLRAQSLEPGNRIDVSVAVAMQKMSQMQTEYSYTVSSLQESVQKVWSYFVITNVSLNHVGKVYSPSKWEFGIPDNTPKAEIRWVNIDEGIPPGSSLTGFTFEATGTPGIVNYYAEGYHNVPQWPGPVEEDSIPGYDDLTPYGPGIVGKTVGPVEPPDLSVMTSILDTLISYKHQCLMLGWLRDDKSRKPDCDEIMKGRDWYKNGEFEKFRKWEPDESWEFDHDWNSGIVRVLDRRLDKTKRELSRGDSVRARKDLEIFVMEVEMLNNLSKKLEARNKQSEVRDRSPIMASEAYALLKYNAEYLIDRLPERHGKVDERRGKK